MNKKEWILVIFLVTVKLVFHFVTAGNYELHRDALLYINLGEHPAWGYASVPPLTGIIANVSRFLLGDSNFAIRFFPAIAGGCSIIVISLIVKDLGGKTFAVLTASLAYLFSVAYLRTNSLLQPVTFNQFFWLLSFFLIIRMIKSSELRIWIIIGILWGIAFLNKYSITFLGVSVLLALLVSDQRKLLFSRYFVIAIFLTLIIALPNLIWQFRHNWPVISHLEELQETQLVNVSLAGFVFMQLLMNAHALLIWLAGILILALSPSLRKYRFIGYAYFFCVFILILLRGKHYYTLGLYTVLFASGAVAFENWLTGRIYFLRYILISLMVLTALPFIPLSAPLLKIDKLAEYSEKSSHWIGPALLRWEDGIVHEIPQDFADMTGWKQLANITASAFMSLDNSERVECFIYAPNYGRASAVNFYNESQDIPECISFNDSYALWAPAKFPGKHLIYVDNDTSRIRNGFESIELYGRVSDPLFRENETGVYICRNANNYFFELYEDVASEYIGRYKRKLGSQE